jgi:fumarylpyruvate hydrolase
MVTTSLDPGGAAVADFVFAPPAQIAVPVAGGGRFPVRRVYCVGRNYAEHICEMGGDPKGEQPSFFSKPADALLTGGADMPYPPMTSDLHHEMELVVAIGTGGAAIPEGEALGHVWGYAAGLDMTRRDLQQQLRKEGKTWDLAKGFDASGPIGEVVPAARIGHPARGRIELSVNGERRQNSDLSHMVWSVPEIIAHLSRFVRLAPGDLIFTGTPEGVGAVRRGDVLEGRIEGVGSVRTRIV